MNKIAVVVSLFIISLVIFTYQSDLVGLEFKGDESFYFQSARQMVESGDWLTPYYFDKARFEKPIFFYWIVALFFKLFGISWKIARMPSAISMALVVVLTYLWSIELFNKKTGLLASGIIISSLATFRYARLALPETFFVLLLCASIYFLYKRTYILAYLVMGVSFLTKGPVGLILPIFIMAGYRYAMGEKGFFKEIRFFPGLCLVLAISLPWFLAMVNVHGSSYIEHIFFRETIQRIGGLMPGEPITWGKVAASFKGLFYFIPVIFIFFLPWSLFLIPSLKDISLNVSESKGKENSRVLLLVWFLAVIIFFTLLGEKHRHYMLAVAVPLSIMVGSYFYGKISLPRMSKTKRLYVPVITSFAIFQVLSLGISKEIGGIGAIFSGKNYNVEATDTVAVGSHALVPQDLETFVNHRVEKYGFKDRLPEKTVQRNKYWLNDRLFVNGKSSFLLIKKKDFDKYVTADTRKGLTILEKGYMYSKGVGLSRIARAVKRFEKGAILDLFREEVYFVTNKSDVGPDLRDRQL